MKKKRATTKTKRSIKRLPAKSLSAKAAKRVRGGSIRFPYKPQKADGSLDAGIHFKYD